MNTTRGHKERERLQVSRKREGFSQHEVKRGSNIKGLDKLTLKLVGQALGPNLGWCILPPLLVFSRRSNGKKHGLAACVIINHHRGLKLSSNAEEAKKECNSPTSAAKCQCQCHRSSSVRLGAFGMQTSGLRRRIGRGRGAFNRLPNGTDEQL